MTQKIDHFFRELPSSVRQKCEIQSAKNGEWTLQFPEETLTVEAFVKDDQTIILRSPLGQSPPEKHNSRIKPLMKWSKEEPGFRFHNTNGDIDFITMEQEIDQPLSIADLSKAIEKFTFRIGMLKIYLDT